MNLFSNKSFEVKKHLSALLLTTCLILLVSCASNSELVSSKITDQQSLSIKGHINKVMTEYHIPGVIVGIWEADYEPFIVTKGDADIESGEDIEAIDKFRIASVTKTFTATIVLQLVEEGSIALEDTLHHFFPEIPHSTIITIRQLLNMTAGVYDFCYEDPDVQSSYLHKPLKKWTSEELYEILISHDPAFPPGEQCVYSNANYFLLGTIIEKVTGNELEEEIQHRIIEPLGLTNTTFPSGPEMSGDYTHGYRNNISTGELEDITLVDPSLPWAGGAIISNLYDLKIWVETLYKGGLLSNSMQQERFQWNTMVSFVKYGLGIMNWGGFIGHNGAILGYNNFAVYLPEKDAVVIVITNKCNDDGSENLAQDIFHGITKILYPDIVPW